MADIYNCQVGIWQRQFLRELFKVVFSLRGRARPCPHRSADGHAGIRDSRRPVRVQQSDGGARHAHGPDPAAGGPHRGPRRSAGGAGPAARPMGRAHMGLGNYATADSLLRRLTALRRRQTDAPAPGRAAGLTRLRRGVPAVLIPTPACRPDRSRFRCREIDPPPSPLENPMSVGLRSDVPRRARSGSSTAARKRSNERPLCSVLETAGTPRHRPFFRDGREASRTRRSDAQADRGKTTAS